MLVAVSAHSVRLTGICCDSVHTGSVFAVHMSVRVCTAFIHRFASVLYFPCESHHLILDCFPQILNHFFSPLCQNTSVRSQQRRFRERGLQWKETLGKGDPELPVQERSPTPADSCPAPAYPPRFRGAWLMEQPLRMALA